MLEFKAGILMSTRNIKLSIAVCAIVGEVITGSHDSLNELYKSAGAPGDPPDLAHHSKWKQWLKRVGDDPQCDVHAVLGKIIEEFMEVEPAPDPFGIDTYNENKKRLEKALADDCLRYRKGGVIEPLPKGLGIESLAVSLRKKDFYALEVEFKRALDTVERDPGSAITAACSILEALFTAYLEHHLIEFPSKQSIKPLWSKVQKHLGLDPKNQDDADILRILSGISSIVDGVGAFRTHAGSAHGGGKLRYKMQPRHAKLTVNSAHTLALFIIETWEERYASKKN